MNNRIGFSLPSLTIFLGSFLIFGVQPMLGRTLLPAFGGTAAVWVVCLAAFQILLLVGYWYAHCVGKAKSEKLKVKNNKREEKEHPTSNIERSTSNAQRLTFNKETGRQKTMHIALLGLAVVWVVGFAYGRPWLMAHIGNGAFPALEVLLCVLAFVGLPYVLLSANSTLIQAWLVGKREPQNPQKTQKEEVGSSKVLKFESSKVEEKQPTSDSCGSCYSDAKEIGTNELTNYRTNALRPDVYRLYAVSNAGSLLGLLCYPFLVEPFLSLNAQWYGFAACLGVYAVLLAFLTKQVGGQRTEVRDQSEAQTSSRTLSSEDLGRGTCDVQHFRTLELSNFRTASNALLLWLLLPATSCFLLNAVTAHLTTDVTPIPLLWVALLSAFLVSYMIGFSKLGEKGVLVWCVLAMLPLAFCAYSSGLKGGQGFLFNLIPGLLLVLLGSTFLHSWLYRVRPAAQLLTRYYLCLAMGGALGGLLSGIVAPLVFNRILEYPLALLFLVLMAAFYVRNHVSKEFQWLETAAYLLVIGTFYFTITGVMKEPPGVKVLCWQRNFYGCLRVSAVEAKSGFGDTVPGHQINHGDTMHGLQLLPHYLRDKPTSYYGPLGGGFAVLSTAAYTNATPMNVGVIGLGAGTMACWGRTNDTYRFFEINPKVVAIAQNTNYFTYLSDSKAQVEISLGDARAKLELERTADKDKYDVLIVDAYSGDAIPLHLATKEAFRLYLDRLKPGGILAVHISNWHIDLNPLCKAVAKEWGGDSSKVLKFESSKVEETLTNTAESDSCGSCYSDAKRSWYASGLKLTGVISAPQGLCSAANWVFISDRELPTKGLQVRETDWTQVRDITLPTDARGSLIGLVRYGHRPPEKQREIDLGAVLKF
jgi:hypothetical protein